MPSMYTRRNHKRCNGCGEEKPLADFYYAATQKSYSHKCKDCTRIHRREQYRKCHGLNRPTRTEGETRRILEDGAHSCSDCGRRKPIGEFGIRRVNGNQTVFNVCKDCRITRKDRLIADPWTKFIYAAKTRSAAFGVTVRDYLLRLQSQEFKCAVCGRLLPLADQVLDHDHATGAARGVLHNKCNVLLGLAAECVDTLRNAAAYLERHRSAPTASSSL